MLIDWFTVGAQAVNFLVLIWLLRRFLYRPILTAIDAREKRIAGQLADAAKIRGEAEQERDALHLRNQAFDAQRAALLGQAAAEAAAERERLLGQARKAGEGLSAKQASKLQAERAELSQALARLASEEVMAIARKALTDLATANLEERISEVFTRRLKELDAEAKATLGAALRNSAGPALLRSSFELQAGTRAAIQTALDQTFPAPIRLQFEIAPAGLCGIELSAGGQKLAWNIADYLGILQGKLNALLDAQSRPPPAAAPRPEPVKVAGAVPAPQAVAV
jgi:F-type H+-transporting ATPase subunit b